jgi:hypothetical protein
VGIIAEHAEGIRRMGKAAGGIRRAMHNATTASTEKQITVRMTAAFRAIWAVPQ